MESDEPHSTLKGGIINVSGALGDIDKPPEVPAVQPNVPEIAPMVFEFTPKERKRASISFFLSHWWKLVTVSDLDNLKIKLLNGYLFTVLLKHLKLAPADGKQFKLYWRVNSMKFSLSPLSQSVGVITIHNFLSITQEIVVVHTSLCVYVCASLHDYVYTFALYSWLFVFNNVCWTPFHISTWRSTS